MKEKRTYAVLGLGIFGSTVSKTLSKYNCDVIAIDQDMECVQRLADIVSVAVQGDITDVQVLKSAGVADCDVALVATGSHLESSLLAIMALQDLGIPIILAKAKNKSHKKILEQMGVDKVILPEKEIGVETAKLLLNRHVVDMVDLDEEYSVAEVEVPKKWLGRSLVELDVRRKFNINVLGIRYHDHRLDVTPPPHYALTEHDHLLIITSSDRVAKLDFLD